LDSDADYARLFFEYEEKINKNKELLSEVASLVSEKPTAIMCMESDPQFCHRSRLAIRIKDFVKLPIINL
jgi:uncharacterized protein (DUF488 family)